MITDENELDNINSEKRIFYIDIGNIMNEEDFEEYVKLVAEKFKKRVAEEVDLNLYIDNVAANLKQLKDEKEV